MAHEYLSLLSPSPGTHRQLSVYRFGDAQSVPHVYLQAGLHADEWPGLLVLQWLLERLHQAEAAGALRGRITVVPYANPVGLSQNVFGYLTGRFDLCGTGNFNRHFLDPFAGVKQRVDGQLGNDEARNQQRIFSALAETIGDWRAEDEATALKKTLFQLSADATVVLDLHCDDRTAGHLYAVKRQAGEAALLAATLGFRYVFLEDLDGIVAFDGSHLQLWERLQNTWPDRPIGMPVFAATLEYRGQIDVEDELARDDAERLLNYLKRCGVLAETFVTQAEATLPEPFVVALEAVDTVKAPITGLLVFRRRLHDWLKAGDVFAEIVRLDDPRPNQRVPIQAVADGYLMGLSHRRLVRPGDQIAKIAGERPLPHREPGNLLQL